MRLGQLSSLTRLMDSNIPKLSRRQEVTGPLFNVVQGYVKSWTDHATLVETAVEEHDNLASSVIIHYLKLSNVACQPENTQLIKPCNNVHTSLSRGYCEQLSTEFSHGKNSQPFYFSHVPWPDRYALLAQKPKSHVRSYLCQLMHCCTFSQNTFQDFVNNAQLLPSQSTVLTAWL